MLDLNILVREASRHEFSAEKNKSSVDPENTSSKLWYRAFKEKTGTLGLHNGETLFVVNKQRKTGICNSFRRG